jgi:SSS family solute:Na+ symporter
VKLSSLVTTIVFFLQIAAEVIVGIAVLRVFIGFNISTIQLSIIVGSTFIIYSIIGGLPSVLKTDVLQYRLVLFALIGIVVIAFNEGGATAIKNIYDNKGTFAPHGYEQWLIILSLLAFNLPLLITDMSVWQRISAAKNVNEAKKGSLTFTFSLFVWMSIIVLFTTGFYTFFVDSNETNIVERMISFYSDSIIYPFLIAGFLGALVSTADTFLISSVQTIIVDWQFSKKFNDNNFDTDKFTKKENINIIKWSRLWVLIFGVFSIIIGIISYLYIEKLIYLLFIVFGLQATLAPSVIICLLDKQSKFKSSAPYYSILLGSIVAILGLILSFFNLTFLNISTAYWTPIVVLIVSIIPIILLKQKK